MLKINKVIKDLDKLSAQLEDYSAPWTLIYKLDKISQDLSDIEHSLNSVVTDKLHFINTNKIKLTQLITDHKQKKTSTIYKELKEHFGCLSKLDSLILIEDIKNN